MGVTVTITGIGAMRQRVAAGIAHLEADLREATLDAAAAGVKAAQREHSYTDHRDPKRSHHYRGSLGLTDTAHAEQPRVGGLRAGIEAIMAWPAPYAVFVDKGTSRARAYPFTPTAEQAAKASLDTGVRRALETFARAVSR
jgi:hypothetical protein